MSTYKVIGSLRYHRHDPGHIFFADLAPDVEARAVKRGNIVVLKHGPEQIAPGSYTLPTGWKSRG